MSTARRYRRARRRDSAPKCPRCKWGPGRKFKMIFVGDHYECKRCGWQLPELTPPAHQPKLYP